MVASSQTLTGEVHRIVFASDSGDFTVARILDEQGRQLTAVGNLAGLQPGEFVKMCGGWVENPKFGRQFEVQSYLVQSPKTAVGLERYLASGILPGVGPKTAARIVKQFGETTLAVLDKTPERLRDISGIGRNRVEKIIASWQARRSLHEVMVFLQGYGISAAFAERIYRLYGDRAVSVLKSNPYRLAWEVHGIGFKKADQIALELGFTERSPQRCEAAVIYLLRSMADKGHVFYPLDDVIRDTTELIEVSEEDVGAGIQAAVSNQRLVLDEFSWQDPQSEEFWRSQALYLAPMFQAEVGAAAELARLLKPKPVAVGELQNHLARLHTQAGVELGSEQRQALEQTLQARVSIITGGPGTGKTTMIWALVQILSAMQQEVLLAAPTGRAAKRLAEAAGKEAKTLHRLLEYRPAGKKRQRKFWRNREHPLVCDWIVIDETSMVDIFLMHQLLQAIPTGASLLLVGDVDQLPSVGSGNVLRDLIDSRAIQVSQLSQIYRQARGSLITLNAHAVNRGDFPKLIPLHKNEDSHEVAAADCLFVREEQPEKMITRIEQLCARELPQRFAVNSSEDIQVITPMHRGPVGSQNLNRVLQQRLNPHGRQLHRGSRSFRVGDRVMQIRNNYDKEVFNGDVGQIMSMNEEDGEVVVRFDFVEASYTLAELDEIELAYAITVHKSQGSEYPVIIVPLTTQHFVMLQRNLLYTAITRGKMLVVLIGSTKAIGMAVNNDALARRFSNLSHRIRDAVPANST